MMFDWLLKQFNFYQTRILLFAVCFALMTNIATIVVLFEQLEHESLCDQQNEFNDFIEPSIAQSIVKQEIIKIPKPNKIIAPKQEKNESKETSILDWRGG